MKRLGLVISCFFSVSTLAQETEITVLGVTLSGSDYATAKNYLLEITNSNPNVWTGTGVSVRVANFGVPVPMTSPQVGAFDIDLPVAMINVTNQGLRKDADVVIVLRWEHR